MEDKRFKVYNLTEYPPPDDFFKEADDKIPATLKTFTDALVLNKKRGDLAKWRYIAHALISAVRPNSFVSSVLVGLSAFLYKKFGSKKLIDILFSLGFSASYLEAVRFETSAIMRAPLAVNGKPLSQMVYDNADFNVQTIDGRNTFHVMGGIVCITPKSCVVPGQSFPRLQNIPSAPQVAAIRVADLSTMFPNVSIVAPSTIDILWLYSMYEDIPGIRGWNSFMENVTRDLPYKITFVACQPFINAPASDYVTIYSALLSGVQKTKSFFFSFHFLFFY